MPFVKTDIMRTGKLAYEHKWKRCANQREKLRGTRSRDNEIFQRDYLQPSNDYFIQYIESDRWLSSSTVIRVERREWWNVTKFCYTVKISP